MKGDAPMRIFHSTVSHAPVDQTQNLRDKQIYCNDVGVAVSAKNWFGGGGCARGVFQVQNWLSWAIIIVGYGFGFGKIDDKK